MPAHLTPRLAATLFALLTALMLVTGGQPLQAASLAVGELRLQYDQPWQRADAETEARAESIILHLTGAQLTLVLPRHQARLRLSEEQFYRQLETVWRAQYGQTARMDWLEAGGLRWRVVRRPSLDQPDQVVFHLVTVIEGRAHHLLAYAPASAAELPEAAMALLNGPVTAPAGGEVAAPPVGRPGAVRPAGWRLARVLRIRPDTLTLDRVMASEGRALRGEGGITGLELRLHGHGLDAFLEGFVWEDGPGRSSVRRTFRHQWQVSWAAPPQRWQDGETAEIVVSSAAGSDPVVLEIRLNYLCGPPDALHALLDGVEGGQADAIARLQSGFTACRDQATGSLQAETTLAGGTSARPLAMQPPDVPALSADGHGLLLLSLQPRAGEGSPGQALLGAAAVHYVYARTPED